MKRLSVLTTLFFVCIVTIVAQQPETFIYATRQDGELSIDLYRPSRGAEAKACIVFVHGGGFSGGNRFADSTFLKTISSRGYAVISIEYRLGMKGVSGVGVFNTKPIENAIRMAVEDLYGAVNYAIVHASEFGIDSDRVVLCGSSAGAITVLQADYYLANGKNLARTLPEGFRFAGVISFAGAVFSREGSIKWRNKPAPTMMFHGNEDKLVVYEQTRLFRKGLFGSAALARRFDKYDHPYKIVRYEGLGHEVAGFMLRNVDKMDEFIETYILQKKFLQIDEMINDPSIPRDSHDFKPADLYKAGTKNHQQE